MRFLKDESGMAAGRCGVGLGLYFLALIGVAQALGISFEDLFGAGGELIAEIRADIQA